MHAPAANLLPFLILIPLILWRTYSRVRRSIGRQTLSKVRPWITIGIFPLLTVLIATGASSRPELLEALAGGVIGGVLLGMYGHRMTKFEVTPQGLYYTPNAHVGIALSVLFVGRVVYRMVQAYYMDPTAPQNASTFTSTPLTLGLFGLLAGYYVSYAIGLVRWRQRVESEAKAGLVD